MLFAPVAGRAGGRVPSPFLRKRKKINAKEDLCWEIYIFV